MPLRTRKSNFTGQLYQLFSRFKVTQGAYVAVNGPWDTYGVIIKSERQEDGHYLNLIRGVRRRPNERVAASF